LKSKELKMFSDIIYFSETFLMYSVTCNLLGKIEKCLYLIIHSVSLYPPAGSSSWYSVEMDVEKPT